MMEGPNSTFATFDLGKMPLISSSFSSSLWADYRLVTLVVVLVVSCLHHSRFIRYFFKTVYSALTFLTKRRNVPGVTSATIEPWAEPSASLDHLFQKTGNTSQKIIWGFWDGGETKLPGFCQLAVESWRRRHPCWTIVILSDENFRAYVSPSEIPSTFFSLKAQYRSDVIRLAVLRRYGGIYLDASYTLYRSLDEIWDVAARQNDLYLTSLVTLTDGLLFPNNCLIVAPNPQNPLLVGWQKLLLEYLERPLSTTYITHARKHPSLQRVKHLLSDSGMGGFKNIVGYFGVLWTLADVLYYEPTVREYVQQHVYMLPSYRWTFDLLISSAVDMTDNQVLTEFSGNESIMAWVLRLPTGFRFNHRCEPELAKRMVSLMCAMKISSDFCQDMNQPPEFHLSRGSTLSQVYQASIDTKLLPIQQADLVGARLVVPRTNANEMTTTTSDNN